MCFESILALEGVWGVCGECVGECLESVWKVCGECMGGTCAISGGCEEIVCRARGRHLGGMWCGQTNPSQNLNSTAASESEFSGAGEAGAPSGWSGREEQELLVVGFPAEAGHVSLYSLSIVHSYLYATHMSRFKTWHLHLPPLYPTN